MTTLLLIFAALCSGLFFIATISEASRSQRKYSTGPIVVALIMTGILDEWYSQPETWDNELDRTIHEWYANAPQVWPKRPYFSPSSATACPRELYVRYAYRRHTAKNKSGGGGTEACERIDGRRTASNSRDEPYAKGTGIRPSCA